MITFDEASWANILGRAWTFGSETYRLWRLKRFLESKSSVSRGNAVSLSQRLIGDYLISTDLGIYRACSDRLEQIFPFCTFGISVDKGVLYAVVTEGRWSFVIRALMVQHENERLSLKNAGLLYKSETYYHNERFHQIHVRNGRLAIANTRSNSITFIDSENGKHIVDIYPLNDASGFPIKSDHNHINSVFQAGDITFFVAHNGGMLGSLVGYIYGDYVRASCFPNRGVHDIIPTDRGLVISDTFGSSKVDHRNGGNLIYEGRPLLTQKPDEIGYMIRGVAGIGEEMLVGHSYHGKRKDRFKGSGGLLVFKQEKLVAFEKVPFAQVYDIVRIDGKKLDVEREKLSASEAEQLLVSTVGPICYESHYHSLQDKASDFKIGRNSS